MALKRERQQHPSNVVPDRPLTLAPRSTRCTNHVCEEIRAAYRQSRDYKLRHVGERTAGED